MDFKKIDTLAKLKANTVGFRFKFMNRYNKNEYEYKIDGTGVSSVNGEKEFRASLESAIKFIEEGRWIVIKTSSEHPHADLIRAYADGAKIQWYSPKNRKWIDCDSASFYPNDEYRVKPEMKKLYKVVRKTNSRYEKSDFYYANIEIFKARNPNNTAIGIDESEFIEVDIDSPDIQ